LEKSRQQNREKNKTYRERLKHSLSDEEKQEIRRKNAERQRKNREKKKENVNVNIGTSSGSVFKTPQVKGKMLQRTRKTLNGTPEQIRTVLKSLLQENSLNESENDLLVPHHRIPSETAEKVEQFYLNDEISRFSPNIADFVTVIRDNEKVKVNVKHLMYSIKECHGMFTSENPEMHISLSKFRALRPKNVLSFTKVPHNVCVCQIHENTRLALQGMKLADPGFSSLQVNYKMHSNFVCADPTEACFSNSCPLCQNCGDLRKKADEIQKYLDEVTWSKWIKSNGENSTPYCNIEKVKRTASVESLLKEIYEQVPQFLDHEFVKIKQESASKWMITQAIREDSERAVICCDFAEKFKCIQQNAPQSAHYGQTPVSIFTVAIYHKGLTPLAIASDFEKNSKECVLAYIETVLKKLQPSVKAVDFWSDNATSQFKNQYLMEAMKYFQKAHSLKISWHFYAPMHGKSIVDGIGANVKRYVRQKILSQNVSVNNVKEFVEAASNMNVDVILVTSNDINRINERIGFNTIIKSATSIKDIKKLHSFAVVEQKKGRKISEKILGLKISPQQ
jgi:Holliday junction resolvasome RuvABC endonuclease subunit